MRIARKILTLTITLYLLVSLVLSCCVSAGVARWEIILHRAPFVLVDVRYSTVESVRADGVPDGKDQHREYIAFDRDALPGSRVLSLFVWNPFTNWCDDMIARLDIDV